MIDLKIITDNQTKQKCYFCYFNFTGIAIEQRDDNKISWRERYKEIYPKRDYYFVFIVQANK